MAQDEFAVSNGNCDLSCTFLLVSGDSITNRGGAIDAFWRLTTLTDTNLTAFDIEFVGLSINNPNFQFDDPPPPMISSEGIVATDITKKFASAASGEFSISVFDQEIF